MKQRALYLFDLLQTDIFLCRHKQLQKLEETECCFHIAGHYWAILRKELLHYEFSSLSEEIRFFKEIKPLFIAEKEYFGLVYHAYGYFEQAANPENTIFCKRESRRLTRFINKHREFYDRFTAGCNDRDTEWFSRLPGANRDSSSHDPLVARLLALKRYTSFIKTHELSLKK